MNRFLRLSLALFVSLFTVNSYGTHLKGGTLTWVPTGNPRQARFEVFVNYDSSSDYVSKVDNPASHGPYQVGDRVTVSSGGYTSLEFDGANSSVSFEHVSGGYEVVKVDAAAQIITCRPVDPNNLTQAIPRPDLVHTFQGNGPYLAVLRGSERDGEELANRQDTVMRIESVLNFAAPNAPPSFVGLPAGSVLPAALVIVPKATAATFSVAAQDGDAGDVVRYRFVYDEGEATEGESGVPFEKLPANQMTIDSQTGMVTWNTFQIAQTCKTYCVQIVAEDQQDLGGGNLGPVKSKTTIELQIWINDTTQTGNPTIALLPNSTAYTVPACGGAVSFQIRGTDGQIPVGSKQSRLEIVVENLPPRATVIPDRGCPSVTGTFSWLPGASDVGQHTVRFRVRDDDTHESQQVTVVITVENGNPHLACSVVPPDGPNLQVTTGDTLTFKIKVLDCPDREAWLELAGGLPPGMTVSPPLGAHVEGGAIYTFSWQPTLSQDGPHVLAFVARNEVAESVPCPVAINVTQELNLFLTPDVLSFEVRYGVPVSFTVTGSCATPGVGLTLAALAPGIPNGATLTPPQAQGQSFVQAAFNWTPQLNDVATANFYITFRLTDQYLRRKDYIVLITVTAPPLVLTIDHPGPWEVEPGTPIAFTVSGTCTLATLPLTLSVNGLPADATLTPSLPRTAAGAVSTQFSWTPQATDLSLSFLNVYFTLSDNLNRSDTQSVSIRVRPPPPTISVGAGVVQPVQGRVWQRSTVPLVAAGGTSNNPGLFFSFPSVGTIDPSFGSSPLNSAFSWMPLPTDGGSRTVTIAIQDEWGQSASIPVTFAIGAPLAPSWWATQHVLEAGRPVRDFAMASQGQFKAIAKKAHNALLASNPTASGFYWNRLGTYISSLNATEHNYEAITQGQVKCAGVFFYDALWEFGIIEFGNYPWSPNSSDDEDYAPAAIGQIKRVFAFPTSP